MIRETIHHIIIIFLLLYILCSYTLDLISGLSNVVFFNQLFDMRRI